MLRLIVCSALMGALAGAGSVQAIEDEHYSLFDPVPEDALRPLCSDMPGFGIPPCIVDAGHFVFELTAVNAGFDKTDATRTSSYAIGGLQVRAGLNATLEVDFIWTPLLIDTVESAGTSHTRHATGDLEFGLKQSLRDPDGLGFSVAVAAGVAIPTNGDRASAELTLPVSQTLTDALTVGLTPALHYWPNAIGSGMHVAGSAAFTAGYEIGAWTVGGEFYFVDDRDPAQPVHLATFNMAAIWSPPANKNLSFDVGADFGLNRATTDVEVYCGVTRRF